MSVSIGELSDRSPALRLDSPGATRLRGPRVALHGPGHNSLASPSGYSLPATPGDHGLTQRGKVLCGVQVPVQDKPTFGTDVRAHGQGQFGFHRTTSRAGLTRREPAVEHNDAATVPHRFVLQLAADLAERSSRDRSGKTVVAHHPGDEQVFHDDGPELAGEHG